MYVYIADDVNTTCSVCILLFVCICFQVWPFYIKQLFSVASLRKTVLPHPCSSLYRADVYYPCHTGTEVWQWLPLSSFRQHLEYFLWCSYTIRERTLRKTAWRRTVSVETSWAEWASEWWELNHWSVWFPFAWLLLETQDIEVFVSCLTVQKGFGASGLIYAIIYLLRRLVLSIWYIDTVRLIIEMALF